MESAGSSKSLEGYSGTATAATQQCSHTNLLIRVHKTEWLKAAFRWKTEVDPLAIQDEDVHHR